MPTFLKAFVSAACLAAIWFWVEPFDLAVRLRHADPMPFAAAVALNVLVQIMNAAKLRVVFPPPRPGLRDLIEVNFIAIFFGSFIPGNVGGEVARWAYLGRASGSPGRALAAILLDRVLRDRAHLPAHTRHVASAGGPGLVVLPGAARKAEDCGCADRKNSN